MGQSIFRQVAGRALHLAARYAPGALTFRPLLHRLRGVQVGKRVFIGEEVYLENDYPEQIEIQDGVQISLRVTVMAHLRGPGRVVIERDAYIGPHVLITTSAGRELRIGEGSVIGAGCVVTRSVPAHRFVSAEFGKPVAEARISMSQAGSLDEFVRGLRPLRRGGKTSEHST